MGWESLIGPIVGGLFGDDKDTQTQTQTNAPWAPAQPYMLRGLEDTEKLGNYYKQNPFNKQQVESYSNLFGDIGNFRNNIAPGLMNFANQGMTGQYQRAQGGRPGSVAGYGGNFQPGGVRQPQQSGGLLGGPFSVANGGGSSGLLDLNGAQNPFANGGITQAPKTVTEEMITALQAQVESPGNDQGRGEGNPSMGVNDGFNSMQQMINTPWGAMTMAVAASLGLLGDRYQDGSKVPVEDRTFSTNDSAGISFGGAGAFGAGDYGDGTGR